MSSVKSSLFLTIKHRLQLDPGEVAEQLQAVTLALFRMELRAEHAVLLDGRREPLAILRPGGDPPRLICNQPVTVDKVEVPASPKPLKKRVGLRARVGRVESHMRDLYRAV